MATVSEKFTQLYRARREMSDPADIARLLIARLYYPEDTRLPVAVNDLVSRLRAGDLEGVSGKKAGEFADWVRDFVTLGQRRRGTSFYPIHIALSRPLNGEESRVDAFILTLARSFSPDERQGLFQALWHNLPPFEEAIHDLVAWQLTEQMALFPGEYVHPSDDPGLPPPVRCDH